MKKIKILLERDSYPIIIDNSFDPLSEQITSITQRICKIVVITDNVISEYHLNGFLKQFRYPRNQIYTYVIKQGEEYKCLKTVKEIYLFLMEIGINRNDIIFSFGGGVVGDIAGFVASTYLRGIPFVQIPTTLLAQIDSSIGGKNGVNFQGIKNIIGSFYQPRLVYTNIEVLKTLPSQEIKNAFAEAIVHGFVSDPELISYIDFNMKNIFALDKNILMEFIYRNCRIKSQIIEADTIDKGERQMLNFGHTFGHAIESIYKYSYSHGECVSLGIVAAIKSAVYLKMIDINILSYIKKLLSRIGLPVNLSILDWEQIKGKIIYDKKRVADTPTFILPKKIGEVVPYQLRLEQDLIEYLSQPD